MAKEKEQRTVVAEATNGESATRDANIINDNAFAAVEKEIAEEKDKKQQRELKLAFCSITYYMKKMRFETRKRRREADIEKEALEGVKQIFERFCGYECTVGKDGELIKTDKKIPADQRLTAVEVRQEKDKNKEKTLQKIKESDAQYRKDIEELRNSYEGEYRWYSNWD